MEGIHMPEGLSEAEREQWVKDAVSRRKKPPEAKVSRLVDLRADLKGRKAHVEVGHTDLFLVQTTHEEAIRLFTHFKGDVGWDLMDYSDGTRGLEIYPLAQERFGCVGRMSHEPLHVTLLRTPLGGDD